MTEFKNAFKTTILIIIFQITPLIVSAKILANSKTTTKSIHSHSTNTSISQNQLSILNAPATITKDAGKLYTISVFYASSGRAEIALKNRNENWKTYAFHSVDVVNGQTDDYNLEVFEDILSISHDLVWEVKINNGDDGYISKSVKLINPNDFFIINSPSIIKRNVGEKYKIDVNYPRGTNVEIALRDLNNSWKTHAFLKTSINNNDNSGHIIEVTEKIKNKIPKMFWEIKITNNGVDTGYLKEFVALEDFDIDELSILEAPLDITNSKGITYNIIVAHNENGIAQISLKDRNNNWKIHAYKEVPVLKGSILTHKLLSTDEITNKYADLVWEVKILNFNNEIAYDSKSVSIEGSKQSSFKANEELKVFPIPFKDKLFIKTHHFNNIKKIEIVEYGGNIVYTSKNHNIPVNISTVNFKKNTIYIFRAIKNDGEIKTYKIFKN